MEEHAEPERERTPGRPAAPRSDVPPVHRLLGLQQLAGNRAVQRLLVRMPNPYEQGARNAVGNAEVDEIGEALTAKGHAGRAGSHKWEDDWVFPPTPTTEPSVFYGHGTREKIGGITPFDFVVEASMDHHGLQRDTAFKFVACGGGQAQAAAGAAFGARVARLLKLLDVRGGKWGGPLKAAEGLVYYTGNYKAVLPNIPPDIDRFLLQQASKVETDLRKKVVEQVRTRLKALGPARRAADFTQFRDTVADYYATEHDLVGRDADVRAIDVPAAGLSNAWLRGRLNDAMDTMIGGDVGWLRTQVAFLEVATNHADNCLADVWRVFAVLDQEMAAKAKVVWGDFRDRLQNSANVPARQSGPGGRVGTVPSPVQAADPDRFRKWQDFGDVLWHQWKAARRTTT
ncbi:hypothetical protein [Saccharothrix syringae]|uniref:Uncharacterized protein n=1 Tax=Saccharothrix syringae TaxID=103733 RepID=A0A5Q0H1G0_SACSY|nr:hypothetical protein [Saccharothrix syringae]QFZ19943.1 hypothetical protein EKG83_23205 [Saccharothrix syringae]